MVRHAAWDGGKSVGEGSVRAQIRVRHKRKRTVVAVYHTVDFGASWEAAISCSRELADLRNERIDRGTKPQEVQKYPKHAEIQDIPHQRIHHIRWITSYVPCALGNEHSATHPSSFFAKDSDRRNLEVESITPEHPSDPT
jgi:hypothetical protein